MSFRIGICVGVCMLGWAFSSGLLAQEQAKSAPMTLQKADDEPSEPISLEAFKWLEGTWDGSGLGGDCTEIWSGVEGNCLVGGFRFVKEGQLVFTEHFHLQQVGDSVTLKLKHFGGDMVGWEERDRFVEFPFLKRDGDTFHFSGLTYRKIDDRRMEAIVRVEGKNGTSREERFSFTRSR